MASVLAEIRPHWGNWRRTIPLIIGRLSLASYSLHTRGEAAAKAVDVAGMAQSSTSETIARLRADLLSMIEQVRALSDERDELRIKNAVLRAQVLAQRHADGERAAAAAGQVA